MERIEIQMPPFVGEGSLGAWAHMKRYMTKAGFEMECTKCGKSVEVLMPARNMVPVFYSFVDAHKHGEEA